MKKEYKKPSLEVVKIEQVLLQTISGEGIHNGSGSSSTDPNRSHSGSPRYDEDLDEEEEDF